jgi:hypothetical protein
MSVANPTIHEMELLLTDMIKTRAGRDDTGILIPASVNVSIRRDGRFRLSKSRHIKHRLAKNRTWPSARPSSRTRARFNHLVLRNAIILDIANLISSVREDKSWSVLHFLFLTLSCPSNLEMVLGLYFSRRKIEREN